MTEREDNLKVLEFEKFQYFKINFALVDDRPQFEHGIVCSNCGKLSLDELGQSQLTELWGIDGECKQVKK